MNNQFQNNCPSNCANSSQSNCPIRSPTLYNPSDISTAIINRPLEYARTLFPDVRVIIEDGRRVPIFETHYPNRINVEVRNGIIIAYLGVY